MDSKQETGGDNRRNRKRQTPPERTIENPYELVMFFAAQPWDGTTTDGSYTVEVANNVSSWYTEELLVAHFDGVVLEIQDQGNSYDSVLNEIIIALTTRS